MILEVVAIKKLILIFSFIISIFAIILSIIYKDINFWLFSLFSVYFSCVIYATHKFQKKIVLNIFLVSFYTFLLGRFLYLFYTEDIWYSPFSESTVKNTIVILIISLVAIIIGHYVSSKYIISLKEPTSTTDQKSNFLFAMQKVSKLVFILTYIPKLYSVVDVALFVQDYGYTERYLTYDGVSGMLGKILILHTVAFYMYLSTNPSKKKSQNVIAAYLLYNFISLFGGARTGAVTAVLIVIYYYVYRNQKSIKESTNEKWISKKIIVASIILAPASIFFLAFWGYYREGSMIENLTIVELFFGFFKSQGGSVNIISYSTDLISNLPSTNLSYTFGPIINFFKHNFITNLFIEFPNYTQHTVEAALYGNNYSQTITYMVMPHNYLVGIGMGSSYIAELFVDFGYFGIIIFNLVLGNVIHMFEITKTNKLWQRVILLLMLKSLINLPRSVAMSWFTDAVNFSTIISILGLYFIAKIYSERNSQQLIQLDNSNNIGGIS